MKLTILSMIVLAIIVGGYFLVRGDSGFLSSGDEGDEDQTASLSVPFNERDMTKATIKTEKGDIVLEIYPTKAPKTTEVFATLAINGFYDGIKFHRVEKDFVVQGGDPLTKELPLDDSRIGSGGPGFTFEDEINLKFLGAPDEVITQLEARGYQYRDDLDSIPIDTGVIAMANSGPNTNGSQFFIVLNREKAGHLNGLHTVFGKVVEGMDIVNSLEPGDEIKTIEIEE